eukprot:TRINITY_DN3329_c0_g1_i2.p1 TRINITY_DN3329_c0_g1~~TRINITY_DN3329_c0_g1_i2.p1  ORF type:complete len:653 (-),score=101.34 TRINITY_DN3329_c0_g1_i2:88-2046(-)
MSHKSAAQPESVTSTTRTQGPRPFIWLQGEGEKARFELGEDAVRILEAIENPVGVIAIAGLYRTGKSFILNQLVGQQSGFDLGATVEPCTQGIWLWAVDSSQVAGLMPQMPREGTIVLLDTEGLGSYTKTETYDIQIFSLALLLSSYFIYNSMGNIDETALDRLSLVVELSKHIRTQSDSEGDQAALAIQLNQFFPTFLWLVRDFSLQLEAGGKQISSNEYLKNALQPVKGEPKRVAGKNQIRQCIVDFFPQRDCFTLKRPVNDEHLLQTLGSTVHADMRPEYLEEVKLLKEHIFLHVQPKRLFGDYVTGSMLVHLARQYVEAINSGSIPTIRTAWENVVEMQCRKAVQQASQMYQHAIDTVVKEFGILESDDLERVHQQVKDDAFVLFRSKIVGDNFATFEQELHKFVDELYVKTKSENMDKSRKECETLLSNFSKHIDDQIVSGELGTVDVLVKEWRLVLDRYYSAAKGPMRYETVARHLSDRPLDHARKVADGLMRHLQEKLEHQLNAEKQRAAGEYGRLNDLYHTIDSEWKRTQDSNKLLSESKLQIERELKDVTTQRSVLSTQFTKVEAERDALAQSVKALDQEAAQLREQVQRLLHSEESTTENLHKIDEEREKYKHEVEVLEQQKRKAMEELQLSKTKRDKCTVM